MSAKSKGPRLWLRRARRDRRRSVIRPAVWLILDGRHQQSTGCGKDDRVGAESALERYLAGKRLKATKASIRDPAQIPVADVLALYGADVAPGHARPRETAQRIERLLAFFGGRMLSAINGEICRAFVKTRSTRPQRVRIWRPYELQSTIIAKRAIAKRS